MTRLAVRGHSGLVHLSGSRYGRELQIPVVHRWLAQPANWWTLCEDRCYVTLDDDFRDLRRVSCMRCLVAGS